MNYRFSANTGFLWKELPFLERIERAAGNGFTAVEFHDEAQRESLDDVKAVLRDSGLSLLGLNTRMGDTAGCAALPDQQQQARDDIDQAIDVAKALGGTGVHVLAGKTGGNGGLTSAAHRECYIGNLQYAASKAELQGLLVLIEPLCSAAMADYALHDVATARRIIEDTGSAQVKIMFDCFHVQRESGDLLQHFLDNLPLIGHVQIAGGFTRAEPDQGEINYEYLLPGMIKAGYTGAFGCEYVACETVEAGLGWRDVFVKQGGT